MRTVYLGTSDFAATVLARLAASPHAPALVVTRPDRPRGRGRRVQPPPVAEAAGALGLELFAPESVNDPAAVERIAAAAPDVVCVCAFGALLRAPLLERFDLLNVHPSLLPRWRGAAPIERAIMAGDAATGVCIMRMTAGLDSGPVCLRAAVPIGVQEDYGALAARLAALAGDLLVRALEERPECAPQDERLVVYAEKIGPADRRLDPLAGGAEDLARTVRALHPHIGALLERPGGEALRVLRSVAITVGEEPGGAAPPPGGLVNSAGRLLLGCAGGALELLEVQPAGGRAMAAADFLRGHPIR